MLTQHFSICSLLLALTARTLAQCDDLCSASADDSDSDNLDTLDGSAGSNFDENLTSAIGADNTDLARRLLRRQDTSDVCCSVVEECAVLNGVPFCYDETTTEFRFGDGTFGFIANSSYYDADGSYIDLTADQTSSAESSTETLTYASASAAAATATSKASQSTTKSGSAQAKQTTTGNSGTPNGGQKAAVSVGFGTVAGAMGLVMACTMGISHFA